MNKNDVKRLFINLIGASMTIQHHILYFSHDDTEK